MWSSHLVPGEHPISKRICPPIEEKLRNLIKVPSSNKSDTNCHYVKQRSNKRSELWKPKRDYYCNWIFVSVEIYGRLFPLRFLRDHANIFTCVLLFWDCYPSTKQCRRGQCPLNHEILDLRGRPTATVQKLCHFGRSFPFGSYQIPEWSDSRWKMVLRMTRALMILERMPPNLMSRNSMKKKLRN